MQEDRRWIWVTGNHDPEVGDAFGGGLSTSSASKALSAARSADRPGDARDRGHASGGEVDVRQRLHGLLRRHGCG
jgi:hypothetical protein